MHQRRALVGFPDGLATQIALRFPSSTRLASLAYSVRLGQRFALLGSAEGLANQDKTARQDSLIDGDDEGNG